MLLVPKKNHILPQDFSLLIFLGRVGAVLPAQCKYLEAVLINVMILGGLAGGGCIIGGCLKEVILHKPYFANETTCLMILLYTLIKLLKRRARGVVLLFLVFFHPCDYHGNLVDGLCIFMQFPKSHGSFASAQVQVSPGSSQTCYTDA